MKKIYTNDEQHVFSDCVGKSESPSSFVFRSRYFCVALHVVVVLAVLDRRDVAAQRVLLYVGDDSPVLDSQEAQSPIGPHDFTKLKNSENRCPTAREPNPPVWLGGVVLRACSWPGEMTTKSIEKLAVLESADAPEGLST